MAIGSTLTKGVRRTGENKKPQLQCSSSDSTKTKSSFRNGSNQGDSDSEATSFSSSVHGSTSSATSSTDRYSSGTQVGNQQRKTLDKLNSKKHAVFESINLSRRRPQSRLMSLPDGPPTTRHPSPVKPSDGAPDLQKPVQKFTRSGSLRSLKILRKKNISSSETQPSTVKDSHSKKATFSSILKDSKFPKQVEPHVGATEPEVLSAAKLCPYEHCSLHGHHHNHEPPVKRFSYLKRRSSKDQKRINPQTLATDKRSVMKKEVKSSKNDVDFSIEFYAKTRPDPSFEPSCSRDDVRLADIMFGVNGDDQNEVQNYLHIDGQDRSIVNIDGEKDSLDGFADVEGKKPGFNNDIQMSMWRIIHQHIVSGLIDQQLQEEGKQCSGDDDVDQGKEIQKKFAIKVVREAIEKILLAEEDCSEKNQGDDQNEPNQVAYNSFSTKTDKPNWWNYVKKVILMRTFITELEKAKKKLDTDKRGRGHVPLVPEAEAEAEAEIVSLRSQTTSEKKKSNEWMLDYALQQVVAELGPTQKRKVALLVKSFETITPKLEKEVAI